MTGQTCALPGCFKPPWQSARQGDSPALACGNLHHQLLMASRFNPALPHPPYHAILDRNATGRCALPSCPKEPCFPDHWCSKKHYLTWLTEFTSSLQPDQMCMLPGCTRHVFVDDNALPSRFCGWRHTRKFVMLSARPQGQLPLVEVLPQAPVPSPASLNESEHGSLPLLHSVMHSFKQFVHFGIAPKNIRVIEDFYEKHPWEFLTEGHACWIIACPKFTVKRSRQLTTKGYHWKQSGRPVKKSGYTVKYYKYTKTKGKEKEPDQQHAESSYTMQEYTLEGIETHTLIRLVKEKPFSKGKLGEEQPCRHAAIADEVDNVAYSEDTGTLMSSWDYDMLIDTFLNDLPPLDEEASGFAS